MKKYTESNQSEINKIKMLYQQLDDQLLAKYNRSLPLQDSLDDRWERAKKLGFGKESSIYNSSCVFGDVLVGKNTWIGPNTILDGSGSLKIGNTCSISAGVQIYSHNTVKWALSGGTEKYHYNHVKIGNCCFIGPNVVIAAGVNIGSHSVIGANSFLNNSFPSHSIVAGNPAVLIGKVKIKDGEISMQYFETNKN